MDDYGYLFEPDFSEEADMPEADNKLMFDLFPDGGAAKQACRVGGLTQPKGKGGY